ncbi:hypothetical protein K8I31_18580 [bacterium]|nr:hypothetical protein [bacterium]
MSDSTKGPIFLIEKHGVRHIASDKPMTPPQGPSGVPPMPQYVAQTPSSSPQQPNQSSSGNNANS